MLNFMYLANLELIAGLVGWAIGLWGIVSSREAILQYL